MPFSGRSAVITIAHDRPSSTSQKYSNELNLSANSASAGADRISTAVPNRPPIAENTRPAPSASLGLALARHRIRLVGVRGRRRRARHPQQAAGNVAGEDRHRRGGHDRRDRRDRRHEERDRHEQRRRHRRGQARHRADEQAEQRRAEHHPAGLYGSKTMLNASRRACSGARPRSPDRASAARLSKRRSATLSTPQGSGTRSSL